MVKLFFILLSFLSISASANDWREQTSANFTIIYNAKQHQLATYYLSLAEKVHSELLPIFKEAPEKTYLVLTDYFDYSNGAATVFPQPVIYLFPHIPDINDSIENHSSWAYLLLKHEYTHILNMHPHNGIPGALHWIFGAWVKPNMFLPNWYLEGLAVERESESDKRFGRLNSSYYQGLLRAYIIEEQMTEEPIDRYGSFDIPQYPYASRPYFLGSFYWKYLTDTYGKELIYTLNDAYSRRLPWIIESPLVDATSLNYETNRKRAEDYYQKQVHLDLQKLNADKLQTKNYLSGYFQTNFAIHPNKNEAIYITKSRHRYDELRHITFKDRSQILQTIIDDKRIARADKMVRAEWSLDGTKILFDRLHTFKGKYQYLDLFERHVEQKKTRPITIGARARDAIYISENEIVYVEFDQTYKLKSLDTDNKQTQVLFEAKLEEKIFRPILFENKITFLLKKPNGIHQVLQLSPAPVVLYESPYNMHSHSVCGSTLCWIDETSGVANFVFLENKTIKPLTNTQTSIVAAKQIDSTIYYSELTANGAFLQQKPISSNLKLANLRTEEFKPEEWKVDLLKTEESTYYSTLHLYPRYWLPFILADENGTYTSIQTSANDPAGLQTYALQVGYYTANEKWDKNFAYQNIYWDIVLGIQASETYEYLESAEDSIERQRLRASATTSLYFLSEDLLFNFYVESEKAGLTQNQKRKAQGLGAMLTYNQVENIPYGGMVPEAGYLLSIGHASYLKKEGYFDYTINEAYYSHYWNPLKIDNHSLYYRLAVRESDSNGRPLSLGSVTIGGNEVSENDYTFSLQGYPSGNFLAWSAYYGQVNYTLPVHDIYRGSGTLPFFFKRVYANIVAEALAIDGAYYDKNQALRRIHEEEKIFSSYGFELKTSAELFYKFPVNIVLGYYFGTSENAGGDDRVYFRFDAPLL